MPRLTGVDHIAITVRDLDASVAFYERLLGTPPVGEIEDGALRRRLFALPNGTNLGLTQHELPAPGDFTPYAPGLDHLGLAVDGREELERWAQHLTSMGVEHGGLVEAPYGIALSFTDPDGTALELFVGA
ncbi:MULTISPECIES: VOC family protein [unclassified Agrococcus]|uniref:VOC family protein n=1 Tax=unclassified Agrococcus TaxID=2615065 RepID=UPI003609EB23